MESPDWLDWLDWLPNLPTPLSAPLVIPMLGWGWFRHPGHWWVRQAPSCSESAHVPSHSESFWCFGFPENKRLALLVGEFRAHVPSPPHPRSEYPPPGSLAPACLPSFPTCRNTALGRSHSQPTPPHVTCSIAGSPHPPGGTESPGVSEEGQSHNEAPGCFPSSLTFRPKPSHFL